MENSRVAGNLLALLAAIPDPRGQQGRRHPLAAMLAAIVCGILTGARGYKAIAQWARSTRDNRAVAWLSAPAAVRQLLSQSAVGARSRSLGSRAAPVDASGLGIIAP